MLLQYRAEKYSHLGPRDAAEVMAYETFELGNRNIAEYLCNNQLKGSAVAPALQSIIRDLDEKGFVNNMSWEEEVSLFREALEEVRKNTGVNISHALWLAPSNCVLSFYCKDLTQDSYIAGYEPGSVILADLGYGGKLYGYDHMPYPEEEIPFTQISQSTRFSLAENATEYSANDFGKSLASFDLIKTHKEEFAETFSEGSQELKKLLLFLWDNGIMTKGCCAGHKKGLFPSEKDHHAYVSFCLNCDSSQLIAFRERVENHLSNSLPSYSFLVSARPSDSDVAVYLYSGYSRRKIERFFSNVREAVNCSIDLQSAIIPKKSIIATQAKDRVNVCKSLSSLIDDASTRAAASAKRVNSINRTSPER